MAKRNDAMDGRRMQEIRDRTGIAVGYHDVGMLISRAVVCVAISALIYIIFCINAGDVYAENDVFEDVYHIEMNGGAGTLRVDAFLRDIRAGEKLCLPAFGQRYGEHFENLRIATEVQKNIEIQWDRYGCFVYPYAERGLSFHYDLSMSELSDGYYWQASGLSAYHRGDLIAFPGESVFIERGAGHSPTSGYETVVQVKAINSRSQVISTLRHDRHSGEEPSVFRARYSYELTRSFWTSGMTYMLSSSSGHLTWMIAVAPQWHTSIATVEREFRGVLDYYDGMMPSQTPETLTIFLFPAEFDARYRHGFARPGGLIMQMGEKAASDAESRRVLIAHELFHLYNGEKLQYDISDYSNTSWFREGMTQYIAYQVLLSMGMVSAKSLYQWIVQCVDYLYESANAGLSSSDYGYYHGFLMSMAIDNQWSAYHTDYSVQNYFKWLSTSVYWRKMLNNVLIRDALELYSSFDFGEFFERYIYNHQSLPYEVLLRNNRLCIYETKRMVFDAGLEYRYDAASARLITDKVMPGGMAEKAGVRPGDILIPSANMDWHDGSRKILSVIRNGQVIHYQIPVTGRYVPSHEIRSCPVTGGR